MGNDLLTGPRPYEQDSMVLIGFLLMALSGALVGAAIVGLVWWLA